MTSFKKGIEIYFILSIETFPLNGSFNASIDDREPNSALNIFSPKIAIPALVPPITTFLFLILVLLGCQTGDDKKKFFLKVKGYAQGSTYSITYSDYLQRDFSYSIDSILNIVDSQLSTYDTNSFISFLNKFVKSFIMHSPYLLWGLFQLTQRLILKTLAP